MNNTVSGAPLTQPESAVVSKEILEREPVANSAKVRHILIGWAQLGEAYGGRMDPRAQRREKKDAEAEVTRLMGELQAGGDFEEIMRGFSEDTGSASSSTPMTVTPDAQLVIEFRQLSLRLNVGEYGVCQSDYGFHIIKRFE
jgi:hypothetical protein